MEDQDEKEDDFVSTAYNYVVGMQEQFFVVIVGGVTWITSFQLNRAVNDMIFDADNTSAHFFSTIILMFLNILFLCVQSRSNETNNINWEIVRVHTVEVSMSACAFTASIQMHQLINEVIDENNVPLAQRHRMVGILTGRAFSIFSLITLTVVSASMFNYLHKKERAQVDW